MNIGDALARVREEWDFSTENDPDLEDLERDEWRQARADKAARQED